MEGHIHHRVGKLNTCWGWAETVLVQVTLDGHSTTRAMDEKAKRNPGGDSAK
jgi:hypothetical protein